MIISPIVFVPLASPPPSPATPGATAKTLYLAAFFILPLAFFCLEGACSTRWDSTLGGRGVSSRHGADSRIHRQTPPGQNLHGRDGPMLLLLTLAIGFPVAMGLPRVESAQRFYANREAVQALLELRRPASRC